jgi:two-component system sensor histidine kinase UhpB
VLARDGHSLVLTVGDRGRGLSEEEPAGTGVRGMRERATLVGGQLEIAANGGAGGCRVRLTVPLEGRA